MADSTDWDKGDLTPPEGAQTDWEKGTLTPPSGFLRRAVVDPALSLAKGVVGVPEAAVGIADLATGGQAGKQAEAAGFRPREARQILNEMQSPELQAAQEAVQNAKGFIPTVVEAVKNPSTIMDTTVQSIPSMAAGGVVGRGFQAARGLAGLATRYTGQELAAMTPAARAAAEAAMTREAITAGAVGEGVTAAGQNTEQVRQEDPNGTITPEGAAYLAGGGAVTGVISRFSGGVANRLGLGTPETALVRGKLGPVGAEAQQVAANKGFLRKAGEGFITEGALEELPQSYTEQVSQNLAQGKPWDEGAAEQAAQGFLAGGLTGAVVGPLHGKEAAPVTTPPAAAPVAAAPLALPPPGYIAPGTTLTVDADGNIGSAPDIEHYRNAPRGPIAEAGRFGQGRNSDVTDVVPRETGTEAQKMGIDATAGPLQAVAAAAIDSGAHANNAEAGKNTDGSFPTGIAARQALAASGEKGKVVRADGAWSIQYANPEAGNAAEKTQSKGPEAAQAVGAGAQAGVSGAASTTAAQASGLRPFPAAVGSLGVPRADMPQITPTTHGPLTQFLAARGISHEQGTVDPRQLKPAQGEYDPAKVRDQRDNGVNRSVLISSDGYILDGSHQWLSKYSAGQPIDVIRFDAPIAQLLPLAKEFPSAQTTQEAAQPPAAPAPDAGTNAAAAPVGEKPAGNPGAVPAGTPAAEPPAPVAAPAAGKKPLSVGRTPQTAEPVSVRDGIVHIGSKPALDFDSGEPITVADGATSEQIRKALKDGNVLSTRQRFFGGEAAPAPAIQTESKQTPNALPPAETKPAPDVTEAAKPGAEVAKTGAEAPKPETTEPSDKGEQVEELKLPHPRGSGVPLADISVHRFTDGTFGTRRGFMLERGGEAHPIGHSKHFASRDEAVKDAIDTLRPKVESVIAKKGAWVDANAADVLRAKNILAWLDKHEPKAPESTTPNSTAPAAPATASGHSGASSEGQSSSKAEAAPPAGGQVEAAKSQSADTVRAIELLRKRESVLQSLLTCLGA